MKRLKSIAWLIITGFFLFAPPGTLIGIALVVAGWLGGVDAVIALVLAVGSLGIGLVVIRAWRRRRHDAGARPPSSD